MFSDFYLVICLFICKKKNLYTTFFLQKTKDLLNLLKVITE